MNIIVDNDLHVYFVYLAELLAHEVHSIILGSTPGFDSQSHPKNFILCESDYLKA